MTAAMYRTISRSARNGEMKAVMTISPASPSHASPRSAPTGTPDAAAFYHRCRCDRELRVELAGDAAEEGGGKEHRHQHDAGQVDERPDVDVAPLALFARLFRTVSLADARLADLLNVLDADRSLVPRAVAESFTIGPGRLACAGESAVLDMMPQWIGGHHGPSLAKEIAENAPLMMSWCTWVYFSGVPMSIQ